MYKILVLSLSVVGLLLFSLCLAPAGEKKKRNHHHHHHGAHLSVVINLNDPIVRQSDDDPGWVLVLAAQDQKLDIDVENSEPVKGKPNLLNVEVVLPTDVDLKEYESGLCKIRFVVSVEVLPKKGDNDDDK